MRFFSVKMCDFFTLKNEHFIQYFVNLNAAVVMVGFSLHAPAYRGSTPTCWPRVKS